MHATRKPIGKREANSIIRNWKTGEFTINSLSQKHNRSFYTVKRIIDSVMDSTAEMSQRQKLVVANTALARVNKAPEHPVSSLLHDLKTALEKQAPNVRKLTVDMTTQEATLEVVTICTIPLSRLP